MTEKITKPRRRRKKKKKKKKPASKKLASDSSDESVDFGIPIHKEHHITNRGQRNSAPSSHISTPQEVLRRRLIENDGYEASQVEQAMEEMWDKGLSFDEHDSVIRFLRSEKTLYGAGTCASTASNSVLTVSTNEFEVDMADHSSHFLNESLEEPEEKGEETTLSFAAANGDIPIHLDERLENNEDFEKAEEEEENEKEPEEEAAPAKTPATIAMKLDTVASFENLTDAIFALTEWVKKAASKDDVRRRKPGIRKANTCPLQEFLAFLIGD